MPRFGRVESLVVATVAAIAEAGRRSALAKVCAPTLMLAGVQLVSCRMLFTQSTPLNKVAVAA